MSKHLARDSAVWNKLFFGSSRQPITADRDTMDTTSESGLPADGEKYSVYSDSEEYNEKARLQNTNEEVIKVADAQPKRSLFVLKALGYLALFGLFLNYYGFDVPAMCGIQTYSGTAKVRSFGGFVDHGSLSENEESIAAPSEIIAVSYPFVPKPSYGAPVHSQVLVDHTFDSWGHPSVQKFSAPQDLDYNKVVLTLNTSVSGVQYDRLAHLYVGGAEIWRTSTVEPGHRSVFSLFKKDVSQYVQLFRENTDITFQLDNLVSGRLNGSFHVTLYADFYLSEKFHSEEEVSAAESAALSEDGHAFGHVSTQNSTYLDEKYKYFDIRKAADKVYPLTESTDASLLPIKHLPYEGFSVALPQVSQNTTRLKLAVFASGNAQEEFWQSNVLDRFTDRFEQDGVLFHGHGPLRFVNVWVDGKKVATQSPQPFIFTGGYSPALWSAVVPVNAFDLPSIDLDISGLLPLLWDSQPHDLRILVDNGLDEVDGTTSGIGNDWIISANLLAYENAEVSLSSGEIVLIEDTKRANSLGISLPYAKSLQQIVDGLFEAEITANLVFNLKNGDVLNNTLTSVSSGKISNVQLYSKQGRSAKIIHTGHSTKHFTLVDNAADEIIHETDIALEYPLTLITEETEVEGGSDLDVLLVNGKTTTLRINERVVMDESNFQNGTSTFHLRETGNYGKGALDTKFKSVVSGPTRKFVYKRYVKAEEGAILSDESSFKQHEKEEKPEMGKLAAKKEKHTMAGLKGKKDTKPTKCGGKKHKK